MYDTCGGSAFSGNAPNSMIAAFWDDLDGTNGGNAYRLQILPMKEMLVDC